MKAIVVTALGGPDKLALQDVADPVVAAGELLIKVHYSGINYSDVLARRGLLPTPPAPFVMGLEVVGTVAAMGDRVEGFAVGQPVAALVQSGHAQLAAVPALLAVPLEAAGYAIPFAKAVSVPCTGVTAYQLLTLVGKLSASETVFVQGASGGVGAMLGQQAKALGAGRVIGAIGSAAKAEFTLKHGYDQVVDHERFLEHLAGATDGRGVDLYLEGVSGKNLENLGALLAPLGRAVYFGDTHFSSETQIAVKQLRAGNWTVAGYSLGGLAAREPHHWRPSAAAVLGMIANGTLNDTSATLRHPGEASVAYAQFESRQTLGKLGFDWTAL